MFLCYWRFYLIHQSTQCSIFFFLNNPPPPEFSPFPLPAPLPFSPPPASPVIATLPAPLSAVAVARDGEIVAAGADGKIYFLTPAGALRGEVEAQPTPIIAVAVS